MTGPLTEDQVLWGAVSMLMKQHGDDAPLKVAERIGSLAPRVTPQGLQPETLRTK